MIHASDKVEGTISAFWVEIDRPGSAPDMCYIRGAKKGKILLRLRRNRYTVVIPVMGGNGLAGYRCACARVYLSAYVRMCACVNEHWYCSDCLFDAWIFFERMQKELLSLWMLRNELLCTLKFERYCRGNWRKEQTVCSNRRRVKRNEKRELKIKQS